MGGPSHMPDAGTFYDLVGNQISSTASPSIKDVTALVLNCASTSDIGYKDGFTVPQNYVGSPALVVTGILDGAPSSNHVLGFGWREKAIANNEGTTGAFAAEQTASTVIGSAGTNHATNKLYQDTITLTGTYAAGDFVAFHTYMDASVTTYTGNFLHVDTEFQFSDA